MSILQPVPRRFDPRPPLISGRRRKKSFTTRDDPSSRRSSQGGFLAPRRARSYRHAHRRLRFFR